MADRKQYPKVKVRAKKLRKTQTPAEHVLWAHLRNRRLYGLKFRRQHPIGPNIVDFYCTLHRLAVEMDGGVHRIKAAYDAQRTAYLATHGIRVLRVTNEMVEADLEGVLDQIAAARGVQRPSPKLGEGQADGRPHSL